MTRGRPASESPVVTILGTRLRLAELGRVATLHDYGDFYLLRDEADEAGKCSWTGIVPSEDTALFLFSSVEVVFIKLVDLIPPTVAAVEWDVLKAILLGMATFLVGGITEGLDGKDGACEAGVVDTGLAFVAMLLAAKAIPSAAAKALTLGHKAAYLIITGGFLIGSTLALLATSGYIVQNCESE